MNYQSIDLPAVCFVEKCEEFREQNSSSVPFWRCYQQRLGFSEKESLALVDITSSFGYKLKTEEHLSDRSCLTCARNFARSRSLNVFPVKNQTFLGSVRVIVDHQQEKAGKAQRKLPAIQGVLWD